MITDDDVMRLFERADPARYDRATSVPDATGYLDALRTRSIDMTITQTTPLPTEPKRPPRWPILLAAAAVVSIVVGALVFATRDDVADPVTPAAPSVAPLPPVTASPTEVATAYLDAIGNHDVDLAASHLSDGALTRLGGPDELRRQLEWARATGFEMLVTSCEPATSSPTGVTPVTCAYDFNGIRSDEIGLGPFGGSTYRFTIQDGKVISLSDSIETGSNGFSTQVWEPFAEWVALTHPDDVAIMYNDSSRSDYLVTDESIRLWEQRTHEYVEHVLGGTATTTP